MMECLLFAVLTPFGLRGSTKSKDEQDLSYHLAVVRGWRSAINIILLWSGVGGQLLTSSCCGQGLVVTCEHFLWKNPMLAALSGKKINPLQISTWNSTVTVPHPPSRRPRHHCRSRTHRETTAPFTITPTVAFIDERINSPASSSAVQPPSPSTSMVHLSAKSKAKSLSPEVATAPNTRMEKPQPSQPSRPPIQEVESSSECTYVTASSDSDDTDQPPQPSSKLILQKSSISSLAQLDTIKLQARVLVSMACNEAVSLQDFDNYIKKAGFSFLNSTSCTDEKPYKCVCIFGPPNIGKSGAASSLNAYINGVRQPALSKKFINTKKTNSPMTHLRVKLISTGKNFSSHSIQSLPTCTPARHMIVIEGHRLHESDEVMNLSNYLVVLTGSPQTLRSRHRPTP